MVKFTDGRLRGRGKAKAEDLWDWGKTETDTLLLHGWV